MTQLPMIYQGESAECGLACLSMVMGYYGRRMELHALRAHAATQHGLKLLDLLRIADTFALDTRTVRVEPSTLRLLALPAVLHWDAVHYVVLKKVTKKAVTVHDPARGPVIIPMSEIGRHITGVAVEFSPRDGFVRADERRTLKFTAIAKQFSGLGKPGLVLACVALIAEALTLIIPYFSQIAIDKLVPRADLGSLDSLFYVFISFIALEFFSKYLRNELILYIGSAVGARLSADLFFHLIKLPLMFFEHRRFTALVAKFDSLDEIRRVVTEDIVTLLVDMVMIVGVLFVLVRYNALLLVCLLAFTIFYILVRLLTYRSYRQLSIQKVWTHVVERNHMLDTVRGIQTTRIFGASEARMSEWRALLGDSNIAGMRMAGSQARANIVKEVVINAESVVSVLIGAKLVMTGAMSLGMLFAYFSYKRFMMASCISISEIAFRIRSLSVHREMLNDILYEAEETDGTELVDFSRINQVSIKDASVRQDNGSSLFENISFSFRRGERIVLAGPSGVGKTTFLKAFMKLKPLTSGRIIVNGTDISTVKRDALLKHIGVVMQNDFLFHTSILDNIALGAIEVDLEKAKRACRTACVLDDIEALPMKFETKIMDMGIGFSAGQIQRILIARALYREPELLIMDEGTANLDERLEAAILRNIRELGITVLQAAHRSQVIEDATQVISFRRASNSSSTAALHAAS